VLDTLADNAYALAGILIGGKPLVDKLAAKLPPKAALLLRAAFPVLIAAVKMSEAQIRKINEQARENHDYLTATLTQFRLDLDQGEKDHLLIRAK
jgi:hypothetical protein